MDLSPASAELGTTLGRIREPVPTQETARARSPWVPFGQVTAVIVDGHGTAERQVTP